MTARFRPVLFIAAQSRLCCEDQQIPIFCYASCGSVNILRKKKVAWLPRLRFCLGGYIFDAGASAERLSKTYQIKVSHGAI
jgi:hypothetical protein